MVQNGSEFKKFIGKKLTIHFKITIGSGVRTPDLMRLINRHNLFNIFEIKRIKFTLITSRSVIILYDSYIYLYWRSLKIKEWISRLYTSDFQPPRYNFTTRYHKVISIELILELPLGTDKFILMRWKWNFGSSEKVQLISR